MKHYYARALRRALALAALLAILLGLTPHGAADEQSTEYIVRYRDPAALSAEDGAPFDVVSEAEMKRLRSMGALEWYEPDGEAILFDDPYFSTAQWNLDMVGAEKAFQRGFLGAGVRVGVLDSGVNAHPDLEGRLLAGHNYMVDASDPDDTSDSYGHGTRVAGLVAAVGEDGYIGTAPGAQIVPLKVTDGKSVKISAVCRAIYGGVDDYGCAVLNMSLGVLTDYESLKEAVEYAEAHGVVVVSAAGNGGSASLFYPAAYDTVIGVGAVDRNGALYTRSNHNESVLLTAPGVEVRTPAGPGGYTLSTGTSFAVPQVSGAAAVLLGADPGMTPATVRDLLAQTAADRGAEGYDEYYGYGVLDLSACVDALGSGGSTGRCSFLPEAGPASAVRNETDEAVGCTFLMVQYDADGVCRSVEARQYEIPAHGAVDVPEPGEDQGFGQFIYETDTMIPLAPERRSQYVPAAPASGPDAAAGFYHVGTAPGVTVTPCDAAGPVQGSSQNVDGVYGEELFYPGADRLRVTLSDTQPGAAYVLTVCDRQTGKVLFADQHRSARKLVFDIAFALPEVPAELCLSVGSTAEGFRKTEIGLYYTPAADASTCPLDESCPMSAFADLDRKAWYHDGVHWALAGEVMNGTANGVFAPDASVTRAMLVTMLWRMEGSPAASGGMTFTDVEADRWYTEAVRWAAAEELVKGYNAQIFGPGDSLSREQLAVILWRYAQYRGADVRSGVADRLGQYLDTEKIAPWALEAMRWAVHTGLLRGVGDGILSPKTGASRAQTATVLLRLDDQVIRPSDE